MRNQLNFKCKCLSDNIQDGISIFQREGSTQAQSGHCWITA
ncbi:hypothetical protein HMPREF0484_0233 [Klebsiella pneumoniae subsp. rhinoscleromatis ATCC 13884]|nr:hypothetical protein HMPREF0484_0233 [Klebsiella pneumoniae subsp. rhinoscleromatis ATCC 13884]